MSENQGKDGEMRFGIALAGASIRENGLDFTRHSVTNQPDLGVDYSMQGSAETLVAICEIGTGISLPAITDTLGDPTRRVDARVDVKTTNNKLTGVTVDKFVSDIKKHPNTDLHILAGGSALTKDGAKKFRAHQAALNEDGKAIVYIPNDGVARLANEYKPEILSALGGPLGLEQQPPKDNEK